MLQETSMIIYIYKITRNIHAFSHEILNSNFIEKLVFGDYEAYSSTIFVGRKRKNESYAKYGKQVDEGNQRSERERTTFN